MYKFDGIRNPTIIDLGKPSLIHVSLRQKHQFTIRAREQQEVNVGPNF